MNPYVEYDNVIPLLAPVDIASTVTTTPYVDLKLANGGGFLVNFGLITSATTTDREIVTMEAATDPAGTEAAISFNYRLSSAVGANAWGTITSATTTGVSMDPANDDGKSLWIEIDPRYVEEQFADARYVRLVLTDTPDMTACLVAITAFLDAAYKQATMTVATASASV